MEHTKDMRKITIALLIASGWLMFCGSLAAQTPKEKAGKGPAFVINEIPLPDALHQWQAKTGINLFYNEAILPKDHKVSGDFSKKTSEEALRMILDGTGLDFFKQSDGYVIKAKPRTENYKPGSDKPGKHKITGYVRDQNSGESLIGASVYVAGTTLGASANTYGYFSLNLPEEDSVLVRISFIGYHDKSLYISGLQDFDTEILLESKNDLEAVTIQADKADKISEGTAMSTVTLTQEDIEKVPTLLGETDLLRVIQLMPGVQSGGEGGTGFYVRGGGPDQNLILLDGVPVYNASHLFGFFSVFNTDAINRVELIKGGFPARYGGRLSSVLDIQMKEGNMNRYTGEGSVGPLAIKLTGEGPIVKNKASFLISARRTFIDLFLLPLNLSNAGLGFSYYFYDVNAKLNWKINDKHRIYLSAYAGDDNLSFKFKDGTKGQNYMRQKIKLGWGNVTGALRWNYVISKSLFMNTTVTYTRYRFRTGIDMQYDFSNLKNNFAFDYKAGIDDLAGALDFDWFASPKHHIKFGGKYIFHYFSPGATRQRINDSSFVYDTGRLSASEAQLYIEDEWKIHPKFAVNVGVHGSGFWVRDNFYWSVQPRVSAAYKIIENLAVKASYAEMAQYIQLLSNPGISLPTDLWLPSTDKIKPQQSRQVALGIFKDWGNIFETSIEGYYKTMNNVLEYKNGSSSLITGDDWEDKLTQGRGQSYGMEVFVRRKRGKLTGWVGYTLSWSTRTFKDLNQGRTFPYRYDRRHDFEITLSYAITKNIDLSATWIYGTGNAITLPVESYPVADQPYDVIHNFGERNGFRMRANHRLDLSVNFNKKTKWGMRTWNISIYNVYNRKNPFYYYVSEGKLKQVSIMPIIPSFSYIFKFK